MNDQPETKAGADERLSLVDLLQPMETFKETDEDGNKRLVTENYVHEGCVLILCGTNGKPIGWLDTHAAVSGRVYRHHIIKPKSADAILDALAQPATLEDKQ